MALLLHDSRCAKCGEPITGDYCKDSLSFDRYHPTCYELRSPELLTWYAEVVEMTREEIEKHWASAKFRTTWYDDKPLN